MKNNTHTFELVLTALMTALIMIATMMLRVPMPFTNGYVHMGDTMIYLAVLTLGKKKGSIAAGTGSALADLLSGYAHYVPWTFVIKALMALVMGQALDSLKRRGHFTADGHRSIREILAMGLAGIWMTVGYYVAASLMHGNWFTPLMSVPGNIVQFLFGMLAAWVIAGALAHTPAGRYLLQHPESDEHSRHARPANES